MDIGEGKELIRKKLRLFDSNGKEFMVLLHAVEYESPYVISLMLMSSECYARLDVTKKDISHQLQAWLNGSTIENPALLASPHLEDKMNNFIKFGRLPQPSSLVLWILSRSRVIWDSDHSSIVFGDEQVKESVDTSSKTDFVEETNPYISTAEAANETEKKKLQRPYSAPSDRSTNHVDFTHTFDVTQQLLGKSNALEKLKQINVKGRSGASKQYDKSDWMSDNYRLVSDINKNRKIVEDDMEERRRLLEISRIRQVIFTVLCNRHILSQQS